MDHLILTLENEHKYHVELMGKKAKILVDEAVRIIAKIELMKERSTSCLLIRLLEDGLRLREKEK